LRYTSVFFLTKTCCAFWLSNYNVFRFGASPALSAFFLPPSGALLI